MQAPHRNRWQMPREALSAPWPWQHETWKIRPLSRLSVVLRAHRLCAFIHLVVRRPMRWTEWSLIIPCYRANILTLLALDLAGHTAHFSVRRINHRVDPRSKHTETTLTLYHFQATNESYDMLWPLPDPCCRFVSEFQIVSVFPASSAPTICQVAGGRCMADAWPLRSLATPILYNTTHPQHLYIHTHIYKYIYIYTERVYTLLYIHIIIYIGTCGIKVKMCVCVCAHLCICVCVCACVCVHACMKIDVLHVYRECRGMQFLRLLKARICLWWV